MPRQIIRAVLAGLSGNSPVLPALDRLVVFDELGQPIHPSKMLASSIRPGDVSRGLPPVVANRNRIINARSSAAASQSNGVAIQQTSRLFYFFPEETYNPRLMFVNVAWWNNLTSQFNIQQIHASIKPPGYTNPLQVMFNGAATCPLIGRTGMYLSDPVGCLIPAGSWVEVRTHVVVTGGDKWPIHYLTSTGAPGAEGVTANDDTLSASPVWDTTQGVAVFGPSLIVGECPKPSKPSILVYGDSIMQGYGDSAAELPTEPGWPAKLLNNRYRFINASLYGDGVTNLIPRSVDRDKYLGQCNYTLYGLMGNDIYGSKTVAQVQAAMIPVLRRVAAMGSRVVVGTITPRASSTDGYVTTANQTPLTGNSARVVMNQWIRDGMPLDSSYNAAPAGGPGLRIGQPGHPVVAYADVAGLVESAPDSGVWKTVSTLGGVPTTDNIHPAPSAIAAIVAGLDAEHLFPTLT